MSSQIEIQETLAFIPERQSRKGGEILVPSLAIVWHPDRTRIGEIAPLLYGNAKVGEVSRSTPLFFKPGQAIGTPMADPHISRSPIMIEQKGKRDFQISPPESQMRILVNGNSLDAPVLVSLDALGQEIIITISDQIIMALFLGPLERQSKAAEHGIIGVSAQLDVIWRMIKSAAVTNLPVLIRGETGTGKELVAQALHALSSRASQSMVSVNMAAIAKDLAAAELFGVSKGAFTGASADKPGLFEQARGSTLFLDEIGNTPDVVQPMLLRTLETGELRRVGDSRTRQTDARVVAATDQDLESATFNVPLLKRLEAFVITVPPLRERRADIGPLILHFLKTAGAGLAVTDEDLPRDWVLRLVMHDWPGNVRELNNVVRQIAIGHVPDILKQPVAISPSPARPGPKQTYRRQDEISESEMLEALDQNGWRIKDTAHTLNVSRTALYDLMSRSNKVRQIDELSEQEIMIAIKEDPDDLDRWASHLRVGRDALKRRIKDMMRQNK